MLPVRDTSSSNDIRQRVQQLLSNRPHESLKDLEMKELHGEDRYIRTLRKYSERLDLFHKELQSREALIVQLQSDLNRLKDTEIQAKNQSKQVNELEKQRDKLMTSVEELRNFAEKQRVDFDSAMEFMKEDRETMKQTLEQQTKSHKIEAEQMQLRIQELESALEQEQREREICESALEQEKDVQSNLQDEIMRYARSWKALEKILKDQVSDLSQENTEYEEKFNSQMETIKQLEKKIDDLQGLQDLVQKEQEVNMELQEQISALTSENERLTLLLESDKEEYEREIADLQQEKYEFEAKCENLAGQMERSHKTMEGQEELIHTFQEEARLKSEELDKLQALYRDLVEAHTDYTQRLLKLEANNKTLRTENFELSRELSFTGDDTVHKPLIPKKTDVLKGLNLDAQNLLFSATTSPRKSQT